MKWNALLLSFVIWSCIGMEHPQKKVATLDFSDVSRDTSPEPQPERYQKLNFMNSASVQFLRQKAGKDIWRKVMPKETVQHSDSELFFRYKRFIDLLSPGKTVDKQKKSNSYSVPLHLNEEEENFRSHEELSVAYTENYHPNMVSFEQLYEEEHARTEVTFELLETLFRLYKNATDELPEKDDAQATNVKKAAAIIAKDKNDYYLRHYFVQGKICKRIAEQLFNNGCQETNEFKKLLFFNTAEIKFKAARDFFKKIAVLKELENEENTHIKVRTKIKLAKVTGQLTAIRESFKQSESHSSLTEIINNISIKEQNARERWKQALAAKKKLAKKESEPLNFPKKIKKDMKNKLKREIESTIDALRRESESSPSRNAIINKINALHELCDKKQYQAMAQTISGMKLSQKKKKVFQEFDTAEELYLIIVGLYLQAFRLNPKQKYIDKAKKIFEIVVDIGSEKINCKPHTIEIKDFIPSFNKKIMEAEQLLHGAENCNDVRSFVEIIKEPYQWMS